MFQALAKRESLPLAPMASPRIDHLMAGRDIRTASCLSVGVVDAHACAPSLSPCTPPVHPRRSTLKTAPNLADVVTDPADGVHIPNLLAMATVHARLHSLLRWPSPRAPPMLQASMFGSLTVFHNISRTLETLPSTTPSLTQQVKYLERCFTILSR